ncbi:MAG TPA: WYL domain-containing protein [Propionibacteriaceae bacterium]
MPETSARLLLLLSLLQARRDWPGPVLAERLNVSSRTVRRDVDRLRELGYRVDVGRGPGGAYRLAAGTHLPPLLFDEDQAVAVALALQTTTGTVSGIEESSARALATVRQVMPAALRHRLDALQVTAVPSDRDPELPQVDAAVLVAIGAAIRAREVLRFDYRTGSTAEPEPRPPRRVEPHHLVTFGGRWYLVAWDLDRADWRTFRADKLGPRTPTGPRFGPRDLPASDISAFVAERFTRSTGLRRWACVGEVVLHLSAELASRWGPASGVVEDLGPDRCRLILGSWSWVGLAALIGTFDADLEIVGPPELRAACATLAERFAAAAL